MTHEEVKKLEENTEKYKKALTLVYADGDVSPIERNRLISLKNELGLSDSQCMVMESHFHEIADQDKITFDDIKKIHHCHLCHPDGAIRWESTNHSMIEYIEVGDTYIETSNSSSYTGLREPFVLSIGQSFEKLLDEYGNKHIYDAIDDGKLQVFDEQNDLESYLKLRFDIRDEEQVRNDYTQANYGLSEKAIENSYYAEQNLKPDHLDENELANYESQEYWKSKFVEENSETLNAIDEYLDKGISPENNEFIIKRTPEILISTNISKNKFVTKIVLTTGVINKAKNIHSLTNEEIKDSFRAFAVPLIIFDSDKERSENKENSVLVITDKFAQNSKPIAFSVNMDTQRKDYEQRITINEIRSIHDRTIVAKNGVNIFNEWVDKGLCRYVDDKKIAQERLDSFQLPQATPSEWQLAAGVQFPLAILHSDENNITHASVLVNGKDYQEIMTFSEFVDQQKAMEKEFREWDDGTYSEETSRRIASGEIFGTYEAMEKEAMEKELFDDYISKVKENLSSSSKTAVEEVFESSKIALQSFSDDEKKIIGKYLFDNGATNEANLGNLLKQKIEPKHPERKIKRDIDYSKER